MHLISNGSIKHNGKWYQAGDKFQVKKEEGERLISHDIAKADEEANKQQAEADAKKKEEEELAAKEAEEAAKKEADDSGESKKKSKSKDKG
ncbi:DUF7210 family protein [Rossellomorea vietnamensis]|uniref:DUF7210 family protein n=1 Tax=Rossellomorea vietnamensis TaxID=218284 RepID=UPI000555F808|nr:hypothetical protein [Rossellomorea vietnamensis]